MNELKICYVSKSGLKLGSILHILELEVIRLGLGSKRLVSPLAKLYKTGNITYQIFSTKNVMGAIREVVLRT